LECYESVERLNKSGALVFSASDRWFDLGKPNLCVHILPSISPNIILHRDRRRIRILIANIQRNEIWVVLASEPDE
jgi:hypothetical protein